VALGSAIPAYEVTAAWDAALSAPTWHRSPVWIHGDLAPGNLLVVDGRLSAVVDFGCLGVGDPACDVAVAWTLFSGEARAIYREGLSVDDATWERGRGWALSWSLIALPYYADTNPVIVRDARRALAEVLGDPSTA
jgi:aminoglycoside phosphotransferase (APT) family kinase protein